jgi:hypothetical protein
LAGKQALELLKVLRRCEIRTWRIPAIARVESGVVGHLLDMDLHELPADAKGDRMTSRPELLARTIPLSGLSISLPGPE